MKKVSIEVFGLNNAERLVSRCIFTRKFDDALRYMQSFTSARSWKADFVRFGHLPFTFLEMYGGVQTFEPAMRAAAYAAKNKRVKLAAVPEYYRTLIKMLAGTEALSRLPDHSLILECSIEKLFHPDVIECGKVGYLEYPDGSPYAGWIERVVSAAESNRIDKIFPYATAIFYTSMRIANTTHSGAFSHQIHVRDGCAAPSDVLKKCKDEFWHIEFTPLCDLYDRIVRLAPAQAIPAAQVTIVQNEFPLFIRFLEYVCMLRANENSQMQPRKIKFENETPFPSTREFFEQMPSSNEIGADVIDVVCKALSNPNVCAEEIPQNMDMRFDGNPRLQTNEFEVWLLFAMRSKPVWNKRAVFELPPPLSAPVVSSQIAHALNRKDGILLSHNYSMPAKLPLFAMWVDPLNVYRGPYASYPKFFETRMAVFEMFDAAQVVVPHTIVCTPGPRTHYWIRSPNIAPVPMDQWIAINPHPRTGGKRQATARSIHLVVVCEQSLAGFLDFYRQPLNLMVMCLKFVFDMKPVMTFADAFVSKTSPSGAVFADIAHPPVSELGYLDTNALHMMLSDVPDYRPGFRMKSFSVFYEPAVNNVMREIVAQIEQKFEDVKQLYARDGGIFPRNAETNLKMIKDLI